MGHWGNSYPAVFTPTTGPRFLGLEYNDLYKLSIPPIYSGYFDLGVRQIKGSTGAYHYLSTRNNNFTNRSQKGKVVVAPKNETAITWITDAEMSQIQGTDNIGWAHVTYSFDPRRINSTALRLSDAGRTSGGATHWVLVEPRLISTPDGGFYELTIDYTWIPFAYGRIFWVDRIGDSPLEVFTRVEKWSWNGHGSAQAKMPGMGGYYRVENVVNGSAVGGLVVGVVAALWLGYLGYKRFGCRVFNKAKVPGDAQQREGLLPTGAASSSSPAPPSSAAGAPPATTS